MRWIKLQANTFEKEEVFDMADILHMSVYDVVGRLCCIWCWFDANSKDGKAKHNVKHRLDKTCEKVGFCDAMIKVGWMLQNEEGISLPNYDRHNGQNAKNRCNGAKRQSKHRAKQKEPDVFFN
jgi:hypothetical protein